MSEPRGPAAASSSIPPPYSVTMTVRNEAATIATALNSILDPLPPEVEVVVVDAESDDGTFETLSARAAQDARLRVVRAPCNRGEGRNRAVAQARSSILVTHIDGDVHYARGVLDAAARALAAHPKVPMYWALGRADPNPSSTKFMVWRREALDSLGGYPATQRNEDIGLILRALRRGVTIRRFVVPRVGDTLDPYERGTSPNYVPWMRFRHYYSGTDRLIAAGFSYPEYVRLLYLTRVTFLRFLAGVGLGTARYLLRGHRGGTPGNGRSRQTPSGGE